MTNFKELYHTSLFRLSFRLSNFADYFTRNGGVSLVNILKSVVLLTGAKMTSGRIRFICKFIWLCKSILRTQGPKGLTLFLKASGVTIQQSIGRHKEHDAGKLGARLARTKDGLPRFIPFELRTLIRKGDANTVKMILTCVNVYRLLEFPGTMNLSSITQPFTGTDALRTEMLAFIPKFLRRFVFERFTPARLKVLLVKFSSENLQGIFRGGPGVIGMLGQFNSMPIILLRALMALKDNPRLWEALNTLWEFMPPVFILALKNCLYFFEVQAKAKFKPVLPLPYLGKLGTKIEAAGKIRIFAMVDAWTQWTLNPLHKLLFHILEDIPMDGTFDQLRPAKSLISSKQMFSLDLKAATDRIPVDIQQSLIGGLISHEFAAAWRQVLVGRVYRLHSGKDPIDLTYAVGQPMGALSSWASLAFVHHFIVQFAAYRAGKLTQGLYRNYAVLGDDIIIGDKDVADNYLLILDSLGVECGIAKSLLSPKGLAFEFAKRTFYRGQDVSPVPIKEFYAATRNLGAAVSILKKYNISLATMLQALGVGYRVRSWLNKPFGKLSSRVRLFILAINIPSTPEEAVEFFKIGQPRVPLYSVETESVMAEFLRKESQRSITKLLVNSNVAVDTQPNEWARETAAALMLKAAKAEVNHKLLYVEQLKDLIRSGTVSKADVQYTFRTCSDALHNLSNLTWFSGKRMIVEDAERNIKKLQNISPRDFAKAYIEFLEVQHDVAAQNMNVFATSRPNPPAIQGIATPLQVRFWKRWSAILQGSQEMSK